LGADVVVADPKGREVTTPRSTAIKVTDTSSNLGNPEPTWSD
jgi:hypothetical protein